MYFMPGSIAERCFTGCRKTMDKDEINFQHDLAKRFPQLSPIELRICTMIHKGMRSGEIARELSMKEHSVENHRFDIRTKLGLKPDQNLQTFLIGL
jgi:DNA-binding NarL/FixJ family response regulator